MLRLLQLLLLIATVGRGKYVDIASCPFWTLCVFFVCTFFPPAPIIRKLPVTRISNPQLWTHFKVVFHNLIALFPYSVFLDAISSFYSISAHLVLSFISLTLMDQSTLQASAFITLFTGYKLFTSGKLNIFPVIDCKLCPSRAISTSFRLYQDSPVVDLCPGNAISSRARRRYVQKLQSAAQSSSSRHRRYRRYHRHYHRRVKFLHHRRKPCPKLPHLVARPNFFQRLGRNIMHRLQFKSYNNCEDFILPHDRHFTSVSTLPTKLNLDPVLHPVLLGIFVSQLSPHIYDDSWGWNGTSTPTQSTILDPSSISQFCRKMDPIKLHRTLNMFSESDGIPTDNPTPQSMFGESS